ncbi:ATP-binding protein [Nocardioides sp. W7]|uniref:sensor histidine kinase n=1 Tax=Nocardioides sp. W7 TaxID=2931390 RepID=UPI001FD17971|nr:ATP-binding protein [Nocardioides sp. W7]
MLPALWLGRFGALRGAVICGLAVALFQALPGLLYLGASGANLSRSVLPAIVAVGVTVAGASAQQTIQHQQRMSSAIFDTVDVGLVLLSRAGAYQSMNRRHEDFIRLAYPDGHGGIAGQTGEVYAEDGSTLLARELTPTFRAMSEEEFDDCRIWVGRDPRTRRALSVSARIVRESGVCDSVEAASPAAEAAGVTLHLLAPAVLPMYADPRRLGQVADNLLSNAVKYSQRGGRVDVTLTVDGDRAQLEVRDTGIGISSADRDRLFTRFFRSRLAEERSIPGVGLGLNITKQIVEAHGGRIEVESVLGAGSVFRVRLPLEEPLAPQL